MNGSHMLVQLSLWAFTDRLPWVQQGAGCEPLWVTWSQCLQPEMCLSAVKEPRKRLTSTLKLTNGMEGRGGSFLPWLSHVWVQPSSLIPPWNSQHQSTFYCFCLWSFLFAHDTVSSVKVGTGSRPSGSSVERAFNKLVLYVCSMKFPYVRRELTLTALLMQSEFLGWFAPGGGAVSGSHTCWPFFPGLSQLHLLVTKTPVW